MVSEPAAALARRTAKTTDAAQPQGGAGGRGDAGEPDRRRAGRARLKLTDE